MSARIGSLFSGYGGLDLAVCARYDAAPAWHCEFDDAPSRILARHWPNVPNHHDIAAIDWSSVEPVEILTGGFPCQDVSVAGRRAGMRDGTRSGLWSHMRSAIDELRPALVVIENVGGLFSAEADRIVEPCPYNLGDADGGGHSVLLRAADAVLGDLASIGYDAQWTTLRAADVGAAHGRLRVFITAHPAQNTSGGRGRGRPPLPVTGGARGSDAPAVGTDPRPGAPGSAPGLNLLPTPAASRAGRQRSASEGAAIRPTLDSIHQLLPTPEAKLGSSGPDYARAGRSGSGGDDLATATVRLVDQLTAAEAFGPYAAAIQRWETILGRPAPSPTEPGRTRPRLSARFVEWLMGLPEGHVTDTPGITRSQQLKALGNGVVPQQATAALAHLDEVAA